MKTSVRIFSSVVFLMMLITSGCGPSAQVDISPAMTMVAFQQTATAAVPINRSIHLTPTASIPITGADTAQAGLESLQLTPTPGYGTNTSPSSTSNPQPAMQFPDPETFVRWYFETLWKGRNYQDLWDNYLTANFKINNPGGYIAYAAAWKSVKSIDINSLKIMDNNGRRALVHVDLTIHMKDRRIFKNEQRDYELFYYPDRVTWMFNS